MKVLLGLVLVGLVWRAAPAAEPFVKNQEEYRRIEQAVPARPLATPRQPRRLLIFTLNVGYGGHPSILYANDAFTLMGQKTGAFATTVSADPAVFEQASLKQYDAVFFNNTVGNCFTNPVWRQNLIEFVLAGGGLLGVHGTSVAFTQWPGALEDWPEFGYLIGARGANHAASDEHAWIKLDDAEHPLNRVFGGQGFEYRDEFFRPQGTYSRERVRVLLAFDTAKTDPNRSQVFGNGFRADGDYALAWVRNYGRGRVFYSTIAHNPYVFWDPKMLEFYLGALQFALGDLPAPTTPSARLTPAVRAQEKLGWRVGLEAGAGAKSTLFEAIDHAAQLGLPYLGARSSQPVGGELNQPFGPNLTEAEVVKVRLKLESAGVRLVTLQLDSMPANEADGRRWFELGRKLGVETFIGAPRRGDLGWLAPLCEQYRIQLALVDASAAGPRADASPRALLRACRDLSRWVGVCGDLSTWPKRNPARTVRALEQRLLAVRCDAVKDRAVLEPVLAEIHRLGLRPVLFSLTAPDATADPTPALAQGLDRFNTLTLQQASRP